MKCKLPKANQKKIRIYFADTSCIFAQNEHYILLNSTAERKLEVHCGSDSKKERKSCRNYHLKAFKHIMVSDCTTHGKARRQGNSSSSADPTTTESYFTCRPSPSTGFLLKAFCYRSESECEIERGAEVKREEGPGLAVARATWHHSDELPSLKAFKSDCSSPPGPILMPLNWVRGGKGRTGGLSHT